MNNRLYIKTKLFLIKSKQQIPHTGQYIKVVNTIK